MRKLLSKVRFLLISAGVPWKDERFSKDLQRWKSVIGIRGMDKEALRTLLSTDKAFRSLYLYRQKNRPYRRWVRLLYPPLDSLYIMTPDIGGGLFIQHGFSTQNKTKENKSINSHNNLGKIFEEYDIEKKNFSKQVDFNITNDIKECRP